MSVALQSPFTGTKRLFDDAESEAQQQQEGTAQTKRVRCLGSPAGRCRPASHASPSHFQHSIPAAALAAVKGLFPDMDAQVGCWCCCCAACCRTLHLRSMLLFALDAYPLSCCFLSGGGDVMHIHAAWCNAWQWCNADGGVCWLFGSASRTSHSMRTEHMQTNYAQARADSPAPTRICAERSGLSPRLAVFC